MTITKAIAVLLVMTSSNCVSPTSDNESKIVFEGRVEKIATTNYGASGGVPVYKLIAYSVVRVCKGKLIEKQIVIDHLVLDGKELEGVKIGDLLCVPVEKTKEKVLLRYNEPGIREESEKVETYYLGWKVEKLKGHCDCKINS